MPTGGEDQRRRGMPETMTVACSGSGGDAEGIRDGTTELERYAVRDLPKEEAIERLYSTNNERLRVRVEAYEAKPPHSRTQRIKRIDAMLEEMGRTGEATREP